MLERTIKAVPDASSRRRIVALFALFALLLCAVVIQMMNVNSVQSQTLNNGANSAVITVTASESSGASIVGTTGALLDDTVVCIGECSEYSANAIACMLMVAIAGLLLRAAILQILKHRLRDTTVLIIAPNLSGPRPITPSLQELSISRI